MNLIGVMQGRLSPPIGGRIQSFPENTWRDEFRFAREAGLSCIEWIYDINTDAANPLRTDAGVEQINSLVKDSGVGVWSICADYYMAERIIAPDGKPRGLAVQHLIWLLERAALLGARYIVLPFVDSSSLRSHQELEGLVSAIRAVEPASERAGVELHLETDLKPDALTAVLERISHPLIRANYDTGNSASLGYDPREELSLLGRWLGGVHVKDRIRGGSTVPLGTGDTDFQTCFRLIGETGFRGPFILQAARQEGLSEIQVAVQNRRFVESHLAAIKSNEV